MLNIGGKTKIQREIVMGKEILNINSILSKRLESEESKNAQIQKKLNIAIEGLTFIVNSRDHLDIARKTLLEIGINMD